MHWNARGSTVVIPDGHLLYCWHHSRYAIWRIYAAGEKARPVGNQTKTTKVSIMRFYSSKILQPKFCIHSSDTWRSTFGQSCLTNSLIWRISMICPICSVWSQKSTTNCTTWSRNCSHRYERFLTFCTSGRFLMNRTLSLLTQASVMNIFALNWKVGWTTKAIMLVCVFLRNASHS